MGGLHPQMPLLPTVLHVAAHSAHSAAQDVRVLHTAHTNGVYDLSKGAAQHRHTWLKPQPHMQWPFYEWGAHAVISGHVHGALAVWHSWPAVFRCGSTAQCRCIIGG